MKDKSGKEITFKEFMVRWKQGIENINPYQSAKTELMSQTIILIGCLIGLGVSIYNEQLWLVIILVGSSILVVLSIIGAKQKIKSLKPVYTSDVNDYKEVNLDEQERTA